MRNDFSKRPHIKVTNAEIRDSINEIKGSIIKKNKIRISLDSFIGVLLGGLLTFLSQVYIQRSNYIKERELFIENVKREDYKTIKEELKKAFIEITSIIAKMNQYISITITNMRSTKKGNPEYLEELIRNKLQFHEYIINLKLVIDKYLLYIPSDILDVLRDFIAFNSTIDESIYGKLLNNETITYKEKEGLNSNFETYKYKISSLMQIYLGFNELPKIKYN